MPNCAICLRPIIGGGSNLVSFGGKSYHADCLDCQRCNTKLAQDTYRIIAGKVYCKDCVDKNPMLSRALSKDDRNKSSSSVGGGPQSPPSTGEAKKGDANGVPAPVSVGTACKSCGEFGTPGQNCKRCHRLLPAAVVSAAATPVAAQKGGCCIIL